MDDKTFSYSDHRYVRFTLEYSPIVRLKLRYKTKNKNFKRFNEDVKKRETSWLNYLIAVNTTHDVNVHVENFMKQVTDLVDRHFRKGSLSYKPTIKWFNNDIRIVRNKVSALYRRHIRNPDDDALKEIYIKARIDYKKMLKKTKRVLDEILPRYLRFIRNLI